MTAVPTKVRQAAATLYDAQAEKAAAEEKIAESKQVIMDYVAEQEEKRVSIALDNATAYCTVVSPSSVFIDDFKLRDKVGPRGWTAITKMVLDSDLLESQVAQGAISSTTVEECTEVRYNKPFVKVTWKAAKPIAPSAKRTIKPRKKAS